MTQKSIICNTTIEAEGLRARLLEEGIESVVYDETNSKVARGILNKTMQVMVREEDYDRAVAVYNDMLQQQSAILPWCPNCGSEQVERLSKPRPTKSFWAGLLLFLPIGGTTAKYRCKDCGKVFERSL